MKKLHNLFPTVAYSHGLEKIYALEAVDINSVKLISQYKSSLKKEESHFEKIEQYLFDFGPGFRSWIQTLVWQEPISVLGLSHHSERFLLEAKRCLLADIRGDHLLQIGLGQGHIDEISSKLQHYTKGVKERSSLFFIGSFIKVLTRFTESEALYAVLKRHGLEALCSFCRLHCRLSAEKIEKLQRETISIWRKTEVLDLFAQILQECFDALIKPWMRQRGGIASLAEVLERWSAVSVPSEHLPSFAALTKEILGDSGLPLFSIEGIYCADQWIVEKCHHVLSCAKSYFVHKNSFYLVKHIVELVQRDLFQDFVEIEAEFILNVLCRSKTFRVRRAKERIVELS